jgi:hypothetical protein
LLLASFTYAVIVAGVVLSEGIAGELVWRETVCCATDTVTAVFPLTDPDVAVTVIAPPGAADPVESVAVALPEESVVAWLVTRVPAVDVKVTVTPAIGLPLASEAVAVIVADADPSAGMEATLLATLMVVRV